MKTASHESQIVQVPFYRFSSRALMICLTRSLMAWRDPPPTCIAIMLSTSLLGHLEIRSPILTGGGQTPSEIFL